MLGGSPLLSATQFKAPHMVAHVDARQQPGFREVRQITVECGFIEAVFGERGADLDVTERPGGDFQQL